MYNQSEIDKKIKQIKDSAYPQIKPDKEEDTCNGSW